MEDSPLMQKFLSHFKPIQTSTDLRIAFLSADVEIRVVDAVMQKLLASPGLDFSLDKRYDFLVEPYTTLNNVVGIVISAQADIGCGSEAVRKILFVPLNDVTSFRFKNDGEPIYTVERNPAMVYFSEMAEEQNAAKVLATEFINRIKNQAS